MPATTHYAVHLECPGLPMNSRIQAEVRFAKALERALGGPDAVVAAYAAWTSATEEPCPTSRALPGQPFTGRREPMRNNLHEKHATLGIRVKRK